MAEVGVSRVRHLIRACRPIASLFSQRWLQDVCIRAVYSCSTGDMYNVCVDAFSTRAVEQIILWFILSLRGLDLLHFMQLNLILFCLSAPMFVCLSQTLILSREYAR